MIKVVKFGGSSLASAEQFKKVGAIIRADEDRRYVVPSAPGKRSAKDTKVTDMLYDSTGERSGGTEYNEKTATASGIIYEKGYQLIDHLFEA